MNGHSNGVDQAIAAHIDREEQEAVNIQDYYGCIKRNEVKRNLHNTNDLRQAAHLDLRQVQRLDSRKGNGT